MSKKASNTKDGEWEKPDHSKKGVDSQEAYYQPLQHVQTYL